MKLNARYKIAKVKSHIRGSGYGPLFWLDLFPTDDSYFLEERKCVICWDQEWITKMEADDWFNINCVGTELNFSFEYVQTGLNGEDQLVELVKLYKHEEAWFSGEEKVQTFAVFESEDYDEWVGIHPPRYKFVVELANQAYEELKKMESHSWFRVSLEGVS